MKDILVTGGAGFIGYHLVNRLLDSGIHVISIDNVNEYYDTKLKRDRLKLLKDKASINYDFYEIDINDELGLKKIFARHDIKCVVNLAAQAGVRYAKKNPDTYIKSNVSGFYNILRRSQEAGVNKVIYASSSSVYGANEGLPFSEQDAVNTPMSIYAATKKCNEDLASGFHYTYGMRTIGLRFFNIYGPFGRPDMAYFGWTDKITKGIGVELRNNGEMWRDMTYIDDCIESICRLIDDDNPEMSPEIYNIGNRSPVKIADLLEYISNSLRIKPNIKNTLAGTEEPKKTWANTEKLKSKIGFCPDTDFRAGMEKFLQWYKKYES